MGITCAYIFMNCINTHTHTHTHQAYFLISFYCVAFWFYYYYYYFVRVELLEIIIYSFKHINKTHRLYVYPGFANILYDNYNS
jgi:hypothetical protein